MVEEIADALQLSPVDSFLHSVVLPYVTGYDS